MICSISGAMNSGKTLYMTYLLFKAYLRGKTILSNYDLNFPHFKMNKDFLIKMSQEKDYVLENTCIGLDELWLWLDSRKSQENAVMTYFFLQSSKDDIEIYFTAQENTQTDIRLRHNLHKIVNCSRVLKINDRYIPIDNEIRFIADEYQKVLYIKATEFKKVNFGLYSELVPNKTYYVRANPIFGLYATRQRMGIN